MPAGDDLAAAEYVQNESQSFRSLLSAARDLGWMVLAAARSKVIAQSYTTSLIQPACVCSAIICSGNYFETALYEGTLVDLNTSGTMEILASP